MPAAESRSGWSRTDASSASSSSSTASISAISRSSESSSVSVISDLPSRLIRFDVDSIDEHDPPLQVLLRAGELVRPQVARRDVRELARGDLEAFGEVLLARADVEADSRCPCTAT